MPLRELRLTNSLLLTIAIAILALPLAPPASSQQPTRTCAEAQAAAQRRLANIRNLTIRTEIHDFSTNYPDHPDGRPNAYWILMQGKAVGAVMNSRQLMKAISTDILNACETIGMVTFGQDHSGWVQHVGLFSDGTIDFFKCAEDFGINPGRGGGGHLRWGLDYCSI